jgi:WhiB family transcriptional regulator, redox-sensing transcriptional regulator
MRRTVQRSIDDQDLTPEWWRQAECLHHVGRVDFFPARGESAREAKAICADCGVRKQCLEYALQWDPLCGVWGGKSERERRQIRRDRRAAAAARP